MKTIRKKVLTDENLHPVAVQIDYTDWLEIENMIKDSLEQKPLIDLSHYQGKIHLSEDPLEYQNRIRSEWS